MKKKIGLGTRKSEIYARRKTLDFEEHQEKKPVRDIYIGESKRHKKNVTEKWLKRLFLGMVAAGIGAAVVFVFGFDLTFQPSLNRIVFSTDERQIEAKPGDDFSVKYSEGLICSKVVLGGIYRFLPPDDISVEIEGFPEIETVYGIDLIPLLSPEEATEYLVTVSKEASELGKISFTIKMDVLDWINRADLVEDKNVKIACYKKAAETDPSSEHARIALGRLYEGENRIKEAAEEYRAVIDINKKNVEAIKSLLNIYKRLNNRDAMIKTYQLLAEAEPSEASDHYYDAGVLAEAAGNTSLAIDNYRKSLREDRAHHNARQKLIKIYEKRKEWQRAFANAQVLAEYNPRDANLFMYMSEMSLRADNLQNSIHYAEKAEQLSGGNVSMFIHLAGLFEKANKEDKAIEYYKKLLKAQPRNAEAHNRLGLLLEKRSSTKEAISHYQKAIEFDKKNIGYLINLAEAYEKTKQISKAAETFEKIVKLDKKNKKALEATAVLYYKAGSKWKSVEAYRALSGLEPDKILWRQRTAEIYEELGRLEQAQREYEKIFKIDSSNKRAREKIVELSTKRRTGGN